MHILASIFFPLLASFLAITTSALPTLPTQEPPQKDHLAPFKIDVRRNTSPGIAIAHSTRVQWNTQVSIGSQKFSLLIDTGSSDLWVFSTATPASQQGKHTLYNPAASRSSVLLAGQKFRINYATPGASGFVCTDKVNIGGAVVDHMAIGVSTNISKYFQHGSEDGILGLGFQHGNSIRPNRQPTFMESVQSSLAIPVMTCNFRNGSDGTLGFGAVDRTQYKGPLTTAPVNNGTDGSWTADNFIFPAGDTTVRQSMLFDTGAIWMTVMPSVAAAYWAKVPGAKDLDHGKGKDGTNWTFSCDTILPDFTFEVGGKQSTIPGKFFNGGSWSNGPLCTGGLQGHHGRGSMGNAFFSSYYVVFNQAEPSISFAPHA